MISPLILTLLALLIIYFLFRTFRQKPMPTGAHQLVVIVNRDLNMSKGKVLSQFGHAIDAMHDRLAAMPHLVQAWRKNGSAKIALRGAQTDLDNAYALAKAAGIPYVRIFDAGRTQVKAGSNTVVVIGPATKEKLEPITGRLSLY